MERMIAYCGLCCTDCEAFIATQKDDDAEREKLAQKWSKEYGSDIKSDDINCDGCLPDEGRHISYCAVCKIRKCVKQKGIDNCAYCDDYSCETLNEFLKIAPPAKENLEKIRNGL